MIQKKALQYMEMFCEILYFWKKMSKPFQQMFALLQNILQTFAYYVL